MNLQEDITIVKVGGKVLEDGKNAELFLKSFSQISNPKILVHGGGVLANQLAEQLDVPVNMKQGRRITCDQMIDIVTMVYAGKINKTIAAALSCQHRTPSIGLCGADHQLMLSERRPPIAGIDYGFVGDITSINTELLISLLIQGQTPIIAPITCSKEGTLLNTNADTVAQSIACALATKEYKVKLLYTMDLPGVLRNPKDPHSTIPLITQSISKQLVKDHVISAGMIPKLENCFEAKKSGVSFISILKWSNLASLEDHSCTRIEL